MKTFIIATICAVLITSNAGVINSGLWSQLGSRTLVNTPAYLLGAPSTRVIVDSLNNPERDSLLLRSGLESPIISERYLGNNIRSIPFVESNIDNTRWNVARILERFGRPIVERDILSRRSVVPLERDILSVPLLEDSIVPMSLLSRRSQIGNVGLRNEIVQDLPAQIETITPRRVTERNLIEIAELVSYRTGLPTSKVVELISVVCPLRVPLTGRSLIECTSLLSQRTGLPIFTDAEREILSLPIAQEISTIGQIRSLLQSEMGLNENVRLVQRGLDSIVPISNVPMNLLSSRSQIGNVGLRNDIVQDFSAQIETITQRRVTERTLIEIAELVSYRTGLPTSNVVELISVVCPLRVPLTGRFLIECTDLLSQRTGLQILTEAEKEIMSLPIAQEISGIDQLRSLLQTESILNENARLVQRGLDSIVPISNVRGMIELGSPRVSVPMLADIVPMNLLSRRSQIGNVGLRNEIAQDLPAQIETITPRRVTERNLIEIAELVSYRTGLPTSRIVELISVCPQRVPLTGRFLIECTNLLSQRTGLQILTEAEREILSLPIAQEMNTIGQLRSLLQAESILNENARFVQRGLERIVPVSNGRTVVELESPRVPVVSDIVSGRLDVPVAVQREAQLGSSVWNDVASRSGIWGRPISRQVWNGPVVSNFGRSGLVGNQLW